MNEYIIEGGKRLNGEIRVQGAKNSALPILAAAAAVGSRSIIHNCPDLTDIKATVRILRSLGCRTERTGDTLVVDSTAMNESVIREELMHEMRSSIIFMGALITKNNEAELTAPGGCDIGLRPCDLHLSAMRALGVDVDERFGKISCTCKKVNGTTINLSFPSVGATENIILASLRASGTTTIVNAAREPEIIDLAGFLNSCGARIFGAGESTVRIEGVEKLHGTQYTIMPDRIVACTYMSAAAVTGSEIIINDVIPEHLSPVISCFKEAGCKIRTSGRRMMFTSPERLKSMGQIITMPYPGFPTDCQALIMAAACVADGVTIINENIFENRFRHVSELAKLGADIKVQDKVAVVNGVRTLRGAHVSATDLRAGAALTVAALCAEGTTRITNINYIERGYDRFSENLSALGAVIKRKE